MANEGAGCARPTGAKVGETPVETKNDAVKPEEIKIMTAKVGTKAPDFQAPAYYRGTFTTVKLADFLGKWVMVCFYPGDFTFV
jgi:peroxiredoxin (alkyl hydroperoxide reductase subunit C)